MNKLINIAKNSLKPGYLGVMLRKALSRATERGRVLTHGSSVDWCRSQSTDPTAWARDLDVDLWEEAERYAAEHKVYSDPKLRELGLDLGGGAHVTLLYFLIRRLRPRTVLETGVAAGHSSRAILTALRVNGAGHLYSSDFPYFRLENPERYVGYLVEEELRSSWTLRIRGDANNLPALLEEAGAIDLFHYDSDKSWDGRQSALDRVASRLSTRAVVVFDDIEDNAHFKHVVEKSNRDFLIFPLEQKFIGLLLPAGGI